MTKGGLARRAAVAAAPAVVGASRLLRPPQRQRRPGVPTHLWSQRPVFTESHFISQKKQFISQNEVISQRKPLYPYNISGYLGDNSSIGKNLHCQIVEIFCNLPNVIYWKKRKILAIMSKNLKNSGLSASLCRC